MAGSQSSPVLSPSRYEVMVPWPNMGKADSKNSPKTNDFTALLPPVAVLMVRSLLDSCLMSGNCTPTEGGLLIPKCDCRPDRPCNWMANGHSRCGTEL